MKKLFEEIAEIKFQKLTSSAGTKRVLEALLASHVGTVFSRVRFTKASLSPDKSVFCMVHVEYMSLHMIPLMEEKLTSSVIYFGHFHPKTLVHVRIPNCTISGRHFWQGKKEDIQQFYKILLAWFVETASAAYREKKPEDLFQ